MINMLALLSAGVTGFVIHTKLNEYLSGFSYLLACIAALLVFLYIKKLLNHYRP